MKKEGTVYRYSIILSSFVLSLMSLFIFNSALSAAVEVVEPSVSTFSSAESYEPGYTGDLNINLPVVTVQGRNGLDFDINLAYHGSGIKALQNASWVGLGWNLPLPQVTCSPSTYNKDPSSPLGWNPQSDTDWDDRFFVSYGGTSFEIGKFGETWYPLDRVGVKIEVTNTGNSTNNQKYTKFIITNASGIQYIFNHPLYLTPYDYNHHGPSPQSGNWHHETNWNHKCYTYGSYSGQYDYIEGYWYPYVVKLSAILSSDYKDITGNGPSDDDLGNWIRFTYENPRLLKPLAGSNGYYQETDYPDSIITPTHKAVFHLENRDDPLIVTSGKDIPPEIGSSIYGHELKKLADISLYNRITDELVGKDIFEYDYTANAYSGVDNRLVLYSVQKKDASNNTIPATEFLYTQDAESPFKPNYNPHIEIYWQNQYDRSTIDMWGYYRDNDIPHFTPGWPDQDRLNATAWVLTRIKYPTGGLVSFEWEADKFTWPGDGQVYWGGGLRITKITREDGLGNISNVTYSYGDCHIGTIPECRFRRAFSHLGSTIVKLSSTGININDEVHYSSVGITYDDGSKMSKSYLTAEDYPNENVRDPGTYGDYYELMAYNMTRINNSWKRGKVKSIRKYGPLGVIDQEDDFLYSDEELGSEVWYYTWYHGTGQGTDHCYLKRGEMRLLQHTIIRDDIWSTTAYKNYDPDNGLPREIIYDDGGEMIKLYREFAYDQYNVMKDKNMLSQLYHEYTDKGSNTWSEKYTIWDNDFGNNEQWYVSKIRDYRTDHPNGYVEFIFIDYDDYGQKIRVRDPNYNYTNYYYGDNDNNFSNSADGLNHSCLTGIRHFLPEGNLETEIDQEEKFLKPSLVADYNDQVTTYSYDSFGRIYTIKIPPDFLPTETYIYYHTTGNVSTDPNYIKITKRIDGSNNHVIYSYYDGFGRLFKNEDIYNRPSNILTKIEYDCLGRKSKEYQPYFWSEGPQEYYEYFYYGPSGRLDSTYLPDADGDGNPERIQFDYGMEYGKRTTLVTNEKGKSSRYYYDRLDRLVTVRNYMPGTGTDIFTDYYWNPMGQCTLIVYDRDKRNITTKFNYYMTGEEKSRESNDFGLIKNWYDANGNIKKLQDSNLRPDGRFLHYEYDALNRDTMIWIDTLVPTQDTTWVICANFENGIGGWIAGEKTFLWHCDGGYNSAKCMGIKRTEPEIYECSATNNFSLGSDDFVVKLYFEAHDQTQIGHYVYMQLLDNEEQVLGCSGYVPVSTDWDSLLMDCSGIQNHGTVKKIRIWNWQETLKGEKGVKPVKIDDIQKGRTSWEMVKKILVKKLYDRYPTGVNPGGYPKGHLTLVEDTTGSTMYIYDARGRIAEKRTFIAKLGDTLKIRYDYDHADNLKEIEYPSGQEFFIIRDKMEWIEKVDDNGTNQYVQYNYTPYGYPLVNSFGDQSSDTLKYLPNKSFKSIKCISPYYGTILHREYHYDKCGNRDSLYTFSGTSKLLDASYQYDNLNRLTLENYIYIGQDFTYQYDHTGNRTHRNSTVYSIENNSNRLLSAGSIDYEYDANGNITKVGSDPNATYITYDHFNKPIKIQEPFKEFSFTYNGLGQRVKKWEGSDDEEYGDMIIEEPLGEPHDDARDLGNLSIACDSNDITVTVPHRHIYPPGLQRNYEDFYLTIDTDGLVSSGNLWYPDSLMTLVPDNAAWEFCIYVKSLNDYGIFDVYGNKHKHPQGMKVSYSGVGAKQSLKITFPSKSINNPNRIRITGLSTMPGYSNGNKSRATDVMVGGSKGLKGDTISGFSTLAIPEPEKERIYYIYDESDNVIAELDEHGNIKAEYLYADGRRVVRFEEGKPRYYYHTDQLNNTIAITGKRTGEPTVTKYYAFGDIREEYGTVKDNRYKFTGKELDGTDLYYFGARYYDKSLGRFLSTDPVLNLDGTKYNIPDATVNPGAALNLHNPQDLNPFVYCINNPLRYTDPDGNYRTQIEGNTAYAYYRSHLYTGSQGAFEIAMLGGNFVSAGMRHYGGDKSISYGLDIMLGAVDFFGPYGKAIGFGLGGLVAGCDLALCNTEQLEVLMFAEIEGVESDLGLGKKGGTTRFEIGKVEGFTIEEKMRNLENLQGFKTLHSCHLFIKMLKFYGPYENWKNKKMKSDWGKYNKAYKKFTGTNDEEEDDKK